MMENTNTPRTPWSEIVGLVAELDPKLELAPVGRQLRESGLEPETEAAISILATATRSAVAQRLAETPAEEA